jgi:cytoskeletal protein RodZ
MSDAQRCPHCKAELPEAAAFCASCGRRIEGWKVAKDSTPAFGETALPGGDEATRQMQPTPSLLRAAAISVEKNKKDNQGKTKPPAPKTVRGYRRKSRLPLMMAMLLVAAGGGLVGFYIMRGRVHRAPAQPKPSPVTALPTVTGPTPSTTASLPSTTAPAPASTPNSKPPTPNRPAATTTRKNTVGKKAHVIASAPVAVKAPKPTKAAKSTPGGALPHKSVSTDSKALVMPTAQHETTGESGAPPAVNADDKQTAEASIDADSVRLVVRQHLPQVRACYARAFKDASPGGAVELGFAIDASGHAKNVRTETNTTESEGLAHCLEARVKEWQFPRPVGGDYELIYPFVFAPGS